MLKKFLIGTIAVLALGLALTASAADFGSVTLRVGSKGEAVKAVQTLVGATPVDGVYGKMTAAKVKAWQANNGLTADGVFGKMSMAKANGAVSGNFPAGCTSAAGFSSTTGLACSSVNANTFPAGCTSAAGFSSTTGAKCDGSTTGTTGPLVGGAGDIIVTPTTTDVESQAVEGVKDTKILGFKVEADGSDVSLSNLKVTLKNLNGASSYRLDRYATEVSVFMGSTKVGSALVSDFTKNGTTYSKSIALSNAVVREGSNKKATFYVTVSGVSSIDSTDMATDNWAILADNIRFTDATGVIMTDGTSVGLLAADSTNFDFTTLAGNGDVKVTVSKGSSNPVAANIKVSDTGSTKNVLMLEFKVKATGTDVSFDTLNIATDESTASSIAQVLGELQLKNGSDTLATLDGSTLGATDTFSLDNTFTVAKDTTETFRVYATINDSDNFAAVPASLKVSFNGFSPEDSNGDTITDTGSANGEYQTFVLNAPIFSLVSKSLALSQAIDGVLVGQEDVFLAKFVFNVTAGDDDIYLPTSAITDATHTAFATYSHTGAGAVNSVVVEADSSTLDDGNTSSYLISAGSTEKFTVSIYVRANDTADQFKLTGFNYALADDTTSPYTAYASVVNTGLSAFETASVYLAK